jgi:NADH-quinone oxidoreductase subunit N
MTLTELFPLQALSVDELQALQPQVATFCGGIVAMLCASSKNEIGRLLTFVLSALFLVFALAAAVSTYGQAAVSISGGMLIIDDFSRFFSAIILCACLFVTLMTRGYDVREHLSQDVFCLILFAASGMTLMVSTTNLLVLFISLEIMSLAIYVLVGMRRLTQLPAEAGIKYFITGGLASALLLYGITLLYGYCGSVDLPAIKDALAASGEQPPLIFYAGAILMIAGMLFKVGAVPFHGWIPDVYHGAPSTITGLMTSAVKATGFGALIRVAQNTMFGSPAAQSSVLFHHCLWIVAVATMFFGNSVALVQTNVKRMLAYSTIAHTGYLLVGLIAGARTNSGLSAMALYLLFYAVMNVGAFAVLTLISKVSDEELELEDFAGLGFRHPFLGFALSVFLLSLAGIPPTAGFFGKYTIFNAAVEAGETWLAVLGVLTSAMGVYYYLRVLVFMYMKEPVTRTRPATWFGSALTVAITVCLTLTWGILPGTLLSKLTKLIASP